jgi:hypothetical protein
MKHPILKYSETILMIIIWLLVILVPIAMFQEGGDLDWNKLFNNWKNILPFLILFLINHFFLIPLLLFKKKQIQYVFAAFGFLVLFSFLLFLNGNQNRNNEARPLMPPHRELREGPPLHPPPLAHQRAQQAPYMPVFNSFLIGLLIIGFDAGFRLNFRWNKLEQERTKLQKENVENQLAFLRNQVSPHFFMNTLNNIHSLIDIDTEEAKEAIIKLSKLMRHLLYDSEAEKIPLKNELDFISSYINLMKLRFSEKVSIELEIPDQVPQKSIPPLLFTSFVENAFKHGISYENSSFIKVGFLFADDRLIFNLNNSISEKKNLETGGIGIENSRKRLDILYGNDYQLNINETKTEYHLTLNLPL